MELVMEVAVVEAREPSGCLPDQWQTGFNAYCDGLYCDPAASVNWQNGWWSALAAEARASLEDTLEYEYDILDREFWGRGNW